MDLTLPRSLFFSTSPSVNIFTKENVFLVTSTIHPAAGPLCYNPTRSIFSDRKRLEQTLRTVGSIRERVSDGFVILLENSVLSDAEISNLRRQVDWLVSFAGVRPAAALRDGPYKGAAEAFMLLSMKDTVRRFEYRRLFKISGRYWLTERFDAGNFSPSKLSFLARDGTYSSRLYCIPKTLEGLYFRQLKAALPLTRRGVSIEAAILKGLPAAMLDSVAVLGVAGCVAPTGDLVDE